VGSVYDVTLDDLQKWWHSEGGAVNALKWRCGLTDVVERKALASRLVAQP
jgi:hypothetical protein